MYSRMLQAQPRHVVAKFNGMSSVEEHEVLKDLPVVERQPDGTPLYGVAECRRKLEEVRNEPVATVKSVAAEMVARQEEQFARQDEQFARQEEQRAWLKDWFADFVKTHREENQKTQAQIAGVWNATVVNSPKESPGISPEQVGNKLTPPWSAHRVRKYANQGLFPKSLHPRNKNAPYVFDPIRVLEDIADIQKDPKRGRGKGRRKSP
jgi:hypothetical protein